MIVRITGPAAAFGAGDKPVTGAQTLRPEKVLREFGARK
jgi:hypothetical protein